MIVLVANLGSTSFKYKLFDFGSGVDEQTPRVLAVGAAERIGQGDSGGRSGGGGAWSVQAGGKSLEGTDRLPDHAAAIEMHLDRLIELGVIDSIEAVEAIGFKAVHGGPISAAVRVDDEVLATMERFADVAPAHNPVYVAAMKALRRQLPGVPQVAAFETGFHHTIPLARQLYGIPYEWVEQFGIRRYGFHGASHRYIATRLGELAPEAPRVISLHLGGSCSISAIDGGRSVFNSFGMTAQSGVFHNNRVGDLDVFSLVKLFESGLDAETIYRRLAKEGGLAGISGVSSDLRDIEEAAAAGNERARLAVDAFVESCRHYVGACLVALGGADAVVFTGGIGQHDRAVRAAIGAGLQFSGIEIDPVKNDTASGKKEQRIDARLSRAQVWVLPTNEELIVARQTVEVLTTQPV